VYNAFFGTTGRSLDSYWRESSYGQTWATGNVYGWYTLDALYTCSQPDQMLAAAAKAADADVNFQNYSRLFLVFPTPSGCSFAGLSDVGCPSYSSPGDGTFTASASWLVANNFSSSDQGAKLAVHEAGHGLGLMHSRSRDFGTAALGALGVSGTINEYGDINSAMGLWNFGHYTGSQKLKLGWQRDGSNVLTVQSSGAYTIQPTEVATTGIQTLKVQRGTGNNAWLWMEYRQPVGSYDSTLNSQIFTGALVHYQDSVTGSYTDLLDYTPGTSSFADAALAAGQSWVDPYSDVSLYVQSATPSGVTVAVNYGAVACTQATPSVSALPVNPSVYAGNDVNYTVSVTNNDSAGCSATSFNLGSTLPAGWATTFSASALTLSPGQTASVTMTKSVPAGTSPAVYPVDASAAGTSYTSVASANVTVMAAPPPLYVTPTVSSSYAPRSVVPMTATVLSGANPAAGASVVFTLTKPGGRVTAKTATTGSTGKAAWSYRLGPKDPKGTYSLTVTATYGTQTAAAGPVTFTVQ
jgi:M6 family metalloprotease-like protein